MASIGAIRNRVKGHASLTRPAKFTERDVRAAVRAVDRAGYQIERVEIAPDGRIIIIVPQQRTSANSPSVEKNPWDDVLENSCNESG
jgi:virulence-associated protein VagC